MVAVRAEEESQEFVEGEPELHAPEEEALELPSEESLLEQELDNEEISEEDLEEELIEQSLEDLESNEAEKLGVQPGSAEVEEAEEEVGEDELEADLEEILQQRLGAGQLEEEEEGKEEIPPSLRIPRVEEAEVEEVLPAQPGEFLCHGCFLLRRHELLADPERGLCRDCSS